MLHRLILFLYGTILLKDVVVEGTSSTQTTTIQNQILEILTPHIFSNTSEEICVRLFKKATEYESCFAKTFPTATNMTPSLVETCLSLNLTKLAILQVDYYTHSLDYYILVGCLYLLPDRIPFTDYPDFIRLLQIYLVIVNYPHRFDELILHFLTVIRQSNSTFTLIDNDLIFKAWRPFSTDILGMVTYNNRTYLDLGIESSLPEMRDKDVEVAFYVQSDFLNKLVEEFSPKEKIDLRLVILLIKNNRISRSFRLGNSKMFGIDFGGICINNELRMIRILYRTADQNLMMRDIGQNDFDPVGCDTLVCSFPRMLFVSLGDQEEVQKFCSRSTVIGNSTTMTWSSTPMYSIMLPDRFCLTKDCNIPRNVCLPKGLEIAFTPTEECHEEDYISSDALELYDYFKCCIYNEQYCRTDFDIDTVKSYAHVKISMMFLNTMLFTEFEEEKLRELAGDVLDKGLEFLGRENIGINYLYCMLGDYQSFKHITSFVDDYSITKKNYVFFNHTLHKQADTIGFAFYRNNPDADFSDYSLKYITDKNVSYDYATDDDAEIVFHLPIESRNQPLHDQYIKQRIFLVRNSSFMNNSTFSCRSRMVVVDQYDSRGWESETEFMVYLKTVDEDGSKNLNMFRREGYWFTINLTNQQRMAFCVSELSGNVCNTAKQVMTYTFISGPVEVGSIPEITIRNRTITPLDMLSQLAISMNPRMKRMFQDYFHLFHIIAITESALSALGLFCIFLSALILKNWCVKKFNTVQLSISLTLEIAFFIIDADKITHIGYLIFYYSVLAQFTWMLIIGYHQYLKFVKVFNSSSINKMKSLIIGWISPALIMLLPVLLHTDCLKCDLCYKNQQIFNYFVIGPASFIILTNLIIYFAVMYNILRIEAAETSSEVRKAKLRAAILFPFLLGISWISIFALLSPWSWISIGGSFMFYVVTPSQGFVLFIFAVLLDEDTVIEWRRKFADLLSKMGRGKKKKGKNEENELKIA